MSKNNPSAHAILTDLEPLSPQQRQERLGRIAGLSVADQIAVSQELARRDAAKGVDWERRRRQKNIDVALLGFDPDEPAPPLPRNADGSIDTTALIASAFGHEAVSAEEAAKMEKQKRARETERVKGTSAALVDQALGRG